MLHKVPLSKDIFCFFIYPRTVIKPPNAEVMEAVDVIRLETEASNGNDATAHGSSKWQISAKNWIDSILFSRTPSF